MSVAVATVGAGVSSSLVRKAHASLHPELTSLRLVASCDELVDLSVLAEEFPTVNVAVCDRAASGDWVLDDVAWRGAFDFRGIDAAMSEHRPLRCVSIRGSDSLGVSLEVLARYQRLILRRNRSSSSTTFDAVVSVVRSLFGAADAGGQSDVDHAIDTWQWLLRLDPSATLKAQLAALLHDLARLETGAHDRLEHRSMRNGNDAVASVGGDRAYELLVGVGVDMEVASSVRQVLAGTAADDLDGALLDDAESLSFLSLMSAQYADHFGLAQTRRKVLFTVSRLSERAKAKLRLMRLRPDVERLL